jgi:uncharacterized protein with HEPN domain
VLVRDQILIPGEAAKNIFEPVKSKNPEVPWRDMMGMRDILAHAYFRTDPGLPYFTGKVRIQEIKPLLRKILRDTTDE